MAKTNYPSITPLTPTAGQSEITFRFNVTSFNEISELYWEVCNEEDPTSTIASGYLETAHDFWPYGVNFEIEITELEYNSGSYICRLSATNSNGTTESTQKCTLEQYIDWAEPESVLAGNRFMANGSEEIGTLPVIDSSEVIVSGQTVTIPAGAYTEEVTVETENADYLCFTARAANSSVEPVFVTGSPVTLYYSTDGSSWQQFTSRVDLQNSGDKIYLYGDNPDGLYYMLPGVGNGGTKLICRGDVACSGNIITLLSKNGKIETMPRRAFYELFKGSIGLKVSPDLSGVTLSNNIFVDMFSGSGIVLPPTLPATELTASCYYGMFSNCQSMIQAPVLPASVLSSYCYTEMFKGCTALKESPYLPAQATSEGCYRDMFNGCTSLNKVTVNLSTDESRNSLRDWLKDTASEGSFYNLGGYTFETGDSGIPSGWTEHNLL